MSGYDLIRLQPKQVTGTGEHSATKVTDANGIWKSGFYDLDTGTGGTNTPFTG